MKIVAKITAALKLEFSVRSSTLDESIPRCDSVLLRRERERGASEERFSVTRFSVARINYRRKGASWRGRRGRDVTSDARFLSRIGRRLFLFLSLSLFLSVWRASFSWKSVVRAPNGGLKISHRPKIVDSCVRAPSTSSSRCPSRESPLLFRSFCFRIFTRNSWKANNYSSARINSPVLIRTPIESSRPLFSSFTDSFFSRREDFSIS